MAEHVRGGDHHTQQKASERNKKKLHGHTHKNRRASRLLLMRDRASNEAEYIALDALRRTQILNQIAHEEGLPIIKKRKSTLIASVKKRLEQERARAEEELQKLFPLTLTA